MKNETALSSKQYGGVKDCSTEHFLLATWDKIMSCLEGSSNAANLVSIDFEKAFNRMDHWKCLDALSNMGASTEAVKWTASFLYNRHMSVKIRQARSTPRSVPGGSPQGSILGNFLFCATTNALQIYLAPTSTLSQAKTPVATKKKHMNHI